MKLHKAIDIYLMSEVYKDRTMIHKNIIECIEKDFLSIEFQDDHVAGTVYFNVKSKIGRYISYSVCVDVTTEVGRKLLDMIGVLYVYPY